ncbi:uncharacterized protein FOMMEDRAFT_25189 [Fomitiporia mediterranea MF3/22]|uniref:uncharacterized protein n=1 Tax=Fomitiporia mediterranea (strain MF3/22) TaxID=694068 RepID=UPI0004407609|nr:uncharacterized protein FOMMEDRAFT_25189 [Fomitiporia mediterranea MF3/22]EJD07966.1 hypothetical protein FOMMEDRAFT_25189 [Fomitiporia mediterranea MF3/22]
MAVTTDLRLTFGAMFIGSLISVFLSGIGNLQAYIYFRHHWKKDARLLVVTAFAVWMLDFLHTIFIFHGMWISLVINWGSEQEVDHLVWSIGASVGVTAFVVFLVQAFFIVRVWKSNGTNFWVLASIITARFSIFIKEFRVSHTSSSISYVDPKRKRLFQWLFTTGLALACIVEIILTSSLCYYLQVNRTGYSTMDEIIHKLLMYTVCNGLVTATASLLAMVFIVTMPHSLLFLSLHFIIAKCYVNSLLATLNSRDALKKREDTGPVAVQISVEGHSQPHFRSYRPSRKSPPIIDERGIGLVDADAFVDDGKPVGSLQVHVHVERAIHSDGDVEAAPGRESIYNKKPGSITSGDEEQQTRSLPQSDRA